MRNALKKYKDSLQHSKYSALPYKEMNKLVIDYNVSKSKEALSEIIERSMRLVILIVNKHFYNEDMDLVMEYIAEGNKSLIYSANKYTFESQDFASFAYSNIKNSILAYIERTQNTVKYCKVKGVKYFAATYPIGNYDVALEEYEEKSYREIVSFINSNIKAKQIQKDLFFDLFQLKEDKVFAVKELIEKYNITSQRIYQIRTKILNEIKKNEFILNKFLELLRE